jgi:uncharacterized protein
MGIWRRIFEFDYQMEMHTRSPSTGGYFASPILYGDRLMGKLVATAE